MSKPQTPIKWDAPFYELKRFGKPVEGQPNLSPKTFMAQTVSDGSFGISTKSENGGSINFKFSRAEAVDLALGILKKAGY